MPDLIPGFVKITEVHREFNTSRKTVERRRDKAREVGNKAVYAAFRLRTRDGEILIEPTLQQVIDLRTAGRVPEWFVSRAWLAKTFGKRTGETSGQGARQGEPPSAPVNQPALDALRQQYEETIAMLREQLAAEREDKRELLRYAQDDKQTFAGVAAQLARALPALEAINHAESATVVPPKQEPRSAPDAAVAGHQPGGKKRASQPRPGWLRRLFRGGRKSTA